MDADDIDRFTSDLYPELAFVLDECGVHRDVQAKIAETGFTEAKLFAKADGGDGDKGLWAYLSAEVLLDKTPGSKARAEASRVVLAWDMVRRRVEVKNESEAQQRSTDVPRTIQRNEYMNVIKAFNDRRGIHPERLQ